jgi:hypothetical protein
VLRQGTNATLTTKDQIDASGRTSIRVFKSRIDTENVGVFLYRAKLLYINETGDTYSNVAIPAAKVNITDPFKAPK